MTGILRGFPKALFLLAALLAVSSSAPALELTARLLTAAPGSWTRRFEPNGHVRTLYVAAVESETVTLQLLRHHDGHIVENKRIAVPAEFIRENGADPDSPSARADTVEHKGRTYEVRVARAGVDDSEGDYYISDAVPANGVIRIDVLTGGDPLVLWTDAYGEAPDDLLRAAGPGQDAGEEYGF